MSCVLSSRERRSFRVRNRVRLRGLGRLRLSAVKTNRHIYLQLIDDAKSSTLLFVTTNSKIFKSENADAKTWCNVRCAKKLGEYFGSKATSLGLDLSLMDVCFDRGGFLYTGVVKALADCLRSQGLRF